MQESGPANRLHLFERITPFRQGRSPVAIDKHCNSDKIDPTKFIYDFDMTSRRRTSPFENSKRQATISRVPASLPSQYSIAQNCYKYQQVSPSEYFASPARTTLVFVSYRITTSQANSAPLAAEHTPIQTTTCTNTYCASWHIQSVSPLA